MKRAIVAALAVLALAACGDNTSSTPDAMKEAAKETAPPAAAPPPASEPTKEAAKKEEPAPPPAASEPEQKVERTPSPPGAKVFLISPKDGDTIHGPVPVKFGVEGMAVVPAGTDQPNSGHHHLLIDTKLQDYNAPIPADAQHKHYGGGQTETAIGLPPGKHTLQDVFADKNHIPHDPPVESNVITITVE